jgi:tetratricopeptide (TPR) repeat protein
VLGFFDTYYFSMSWVSDHFAYLALLPVTALLGAILGCPERGTGNAAHSASNIQHPTFKALTAVVVLALAVLTMQRARVMASDEALWRDTVAKNPAAWVAHNNLGCILAEQGKLDEAVEHFEASLQANPRNAEAHRNLGRALVIQERFAKAEEHLRRAVQLNPKDAEAQRTLASALMGLGKPAEAVAALRTALRITPDAETRIELANILRSLGKPGEAIAQLRLAVAAKPDSAEALSDLAWLLATAPDASLRNGDEAVQFAERACRLTGEVNAMMITARAAAYAEAERFAEAVASAEKAISLANAEGNASFAKLNQQLLRLYRARLPYHEPPPQQQPPGR